MSNNSCTVTTDIKIVFLLLSSINTFKDDNILKSTKTKYDDKMNEIPEITTKRISLPRKELSINAKVAIINECMKEYDKHSLITLS